MSIASPTMFTLADLAVGQPGVCFAVLVKREEKVNKKGEPYFECQFRAKHATKVAKVWNNLASYPAVADCVEGRAYRVTAQGENAYGSDLRVLAIEPAEGHDGFDLQDLIPSSLIPPDELWDALRRVIHGEIRDPFLQGLVRGVLNRNRELFRFMPAAQSFHHPYNSGLLEHVWSLTRVCSALTDHYSGYYKDLDPPINKDLILTAAILHDIGKLKELNYDPFGATYSVPGQLIGHVVMGRDMVREEAARVEGFPAPTLEHLEHIILSHHGRKDFGAPVIPQTLEALIVSMADDLDAKINAVAQELLHPSGDDEEFTGWIKPLERKFFRGYRGASPADPAEPTADAHGRNGA